MSQMSQINIVLKKKKPKQQKIPMLSHLLVFPELRFDGDWDAIVLDLTAIQQLLQKPSLLRFLLDHCFRHTGRVRDASLKSGLYWIYYNVRDRGVLSQWYPKTSYAPKIYHSNRSTQQRVPHHNNSYYR